MARYRKTLRGYLAGDGSGAAQAPLRPARPHPMFALGTVNAYWPLSQRKRTGKLTAGSTAALECLSSRHQQFGRPKSLTSEAATVCRMMELNVHHRHLNSIPTACWEEYHPDRQGKQLE